MPTDERSPKQLYHLLKSIGGAFAFVSGLGSGVVGFVLLVQGEPGLVAIVLLAAGIAVVWLCSICVYFRIGVTLESALRQTALAVMVGVPVFLLGGGAGRWFFAERSPVHVSFNAPVTSIKSLSNLGLTVLNPSEESWTAAPPSGLLTLVTGRGDFWWKPHESMPPQNIVVRKLRRKHFAITTKIVNFKPNSDWQQAGIVILDGDEFSGYVRLTIGYDTKQCPNLPIRVQRVMRTPATNENLEQSVCLRLAGEPIKRVWLQIIRQGNRFRFRYKLDEEYWSWREKLDPVVLKVGQRYAGLTAFQGVSSPDGKPRTQPAEPAYFAFLDITP